MKILFAAPDRDLLECYKKLFEYDLGQTVTAFDGTQVISLLSSEDFDILLLDRKIPRVDHKVIIERANSKNIPVIVLTGEAAAVQSAHEPLSYVIVSYPFTFAAIKGTILDTLDGRGKEERTESVSKDE